jgi:transposase
LICAPACGCRKALVDQRTEWLQRVHAVLFHHGVPTQAGRLGRLEGDRARDQLTRLALPAAAQQQIAVALAMVEHLNAQLKPLDLELERDARRLHGCRALMEHYGIGAKVATAILAEPGVSSACRSGSSAGRKRRHGRLANPRWRVSIARAFVSEFCAS